MKNDFLFLFWQQSGPRCHPQDGNTGGETGSWGEDEFSMDLWAQQCLLDPIGSVQAEVSERELG